MRNLLTHILFSFFAVLNLTAQIPSFKESKYIGDCTGAVEEIHFTESNIQFPGGHGKHDDLSGLYVDFFEVNCVWLKMEPNLKGKFGFELTSESNIDFGYYVFKDSLGDFCDRLLKGNIKPIVYDSLSLLTKGLGEPRLTSSEKFKPYIVTDYEDLYYVMVYSNSAYTGSFKIKYDRVGDVRVPFSRIQNHKKNNEFKDVKISIRNKITGHPVIANLTVIGMKIDDNLYQGSDFIFDAVMHREVDLYANAKGYFLFNKKIKYNAEEGIEIIIEMEPLAAGKKLQLEGLKFEQDSKEFIPISYIALQRLLEFMTLNKDVKIEIQGHVNAPGLGGKKRVMTLSEGRAKMAYLYLVDNGIDKKRVTYKGYGSTEMIYPSPKTPEQEEANRRVEILIID